MFSRKRRESAEISENLRKCSVYPLGSSPSARPDLLQNAEYEYASQYKVEQYVAPNVVATWLADWRSSRVVPAPPKSAKLLQMEAAFRIEKEKVAAMLEAAKVPDTSSKLRGWEWPCAQPGQGFGPNFLGESRILVPSVLLIQYLQDS